MVCPVGLNADAACAAMRAGIANFMELPYRDNRGEPIIGAMVPGLDGELLFPDRLLELLTAALQDCIEKSPDLNWDTVPLLVGLPERERPMGNAAALESLIAKTEEALDVRFHPRHSRTLSSGHVAGFEALRISRDLLKDPNIPACLVCGSDSYVNAGSLLWLDQHWRLKTDENSDGVIPGEAAAAVLVERPSPPGKHAVVEVAGLGFGFEPAGVLVEEPLLGLGLAEAVQTALTEAALGLHEIDFRFSDLTGESYGFKEQTLVVGRLLRARREAIPLWHCGDRIGDTGAAAGICQIVYASQMLASGLLLGETVLAHGSGLAGNRAAAILRARSASIF